MKRHGGNVFTLLCAVLGALWLVGAVIVGVAEGLFWCLSLARTVLVGSADFIGGQWRTRGAKMHCPAGHRFSLNDLDLECQGCGYRYRGSALRCPNRECPEPSAAWVNCPQCTLSCRSPYRLGVW